MQYSLSNQPLSWKEFISEYEPLYYLTSQYKLIRNKTSPFVEKEIDNILRNGFSPDDLPLILAWKIGTIDHKESIDKIVYKNNCNISLEFRTQYNVISAQPLVKYIKNNFDYLQQLSETNPKELFTKLCENTVKYFGSTYILTLVYFLSYGNLPIYDKFAHTALLAIKQDIKPGQSVNYKSINSSNAWKTYNDYRNLLFAVVGEKEYKDRSVDRSLWVYGHAFKLSETE